MRSQLYCSARKLVVSFLLLFTSLYLLPTTTLSQTIEYPVTATVRISICGDGVAEGDEDCDGIDLRNFKCEDVGYKPGGLKCSPACEFDISKCGDPLPTATPTIATSDSSNIYGNSGNTPSVEHRQDTVKKLDNVVDKLIMRITAAVHKLPQAIKFYDSNTDGNILRSELADAVSMWVKELRNSRAKSERCDINSDGVCNLIDFSILMYHVR